MHGWTAGPRRMLKIIAVLHCTLPTAEYTRRMHGWIAGPWRMLKIREAREEAYLLVLVSSPWRAGSILAKFSIQSSPAIGCRAGAVRLQNNLRAAMTYLSLKLQFMWKGSSPS